MSNRCKQFGYSSSNFSYTLKPKFNLRSGLKVSLKSKDPLEVFKIFFCQKLEDLLISNANPKIILTVARKKYLVQLLYKYIGFIIFSGIIDLPQEKLYFGCGVGHINSYFSDQTHFISLDEIQHCKKWFIGDRDSLTNIYNENMKLVWNPSQLSIDLIKK